MLTTLIRTILKTPRKRLLLIGAILLLAILIITAYFIDQSTSKPTPKADQPKAKYSKITPGQTTETELTQQLGAPSNVYQLDDYQVYTYPSTTSHYAPDKIYVKNKTVILKELYYTPIQYKYPLSDLLNQAGQQYQTYYPPYSPYSQTKVLFFQSQGLAAYVNQNDNTIFKLQYFSPISNQTFLDLWGKTLTTTNPTPPPPPNLHQHN